MSNGDATLAFKNDMAGVSAEDIATDMSKIKDSVAEMISASGDLRYDLILSGGSAHAWVTELGSIEENGSFANFVGEMLENECGFSDMTVSYESGDKTFDVKYDGHFKINGETVDTNYARYENPYVVGGSTERGAKVIELSFGGYTLTLNFDAASREEG